MDDPSDQLEKKAINIGLLALVSELIELTGSDGAKAQWRRKGDDMAEVILWPSPIVHNIELISIGRGPEYNTYYVNGILDGKEVKILSKDTSFPFADIF
jgi:hypothetical protein